MFQKIDEMVKELPNICVIANDMLIVHYDDYGADHERIVHRVLQICRKEHWKLDKDKYHFRCTSVPFFGEILSRYAVQNNSWNLCTLPGASNNLRRNYNYS